MLIFKTLQRLIQSIQWTKLLKALHRSQLILSWDWR
jgi:hypothetical protein